MHRDGLTKSLVLIWPENTGVFAVSVNKKNDIDASFHTINEGLNKASKLAGDNLDAELSTYYIILREKMVLHIHLMAKKA